MQNVLPLRWRRTPGFAADPGTAHVRTEHERSVVSARLDDGTIADEGAATRSATVTVAAVDLGSLASFAARCALVAAAAAGVATLALWIIAVASGVVGRAESFMESIGFRDFHISTAAVVLGTTIVVAGVAMCVATLVVVAGGAYNLLAHNGHGIRIRLVDDDVVAADVPALPVPLRRSQPDGNAPGDPAA